MEKNIEQDFEMEEFSKKAQKWWKCEKLSKREIYIKFLFDFKFAP